MSFFQIAFLGIVQGLAELLPVSSSAHVIVAEKIMGLNPSSPEMTFMLVMLHTGTMFAVMAYFWPRWRAIFRQSAEDGTGFGRPAFIKSLVVATACTGVVGLGLKAVIEHVVLAGTPKAEVEELFANLPLMAASLATAGVLIVISGFLGARRRDLQPLTSAGAAVIGVIQGLCLPFRGFSRSGATISTGILRGLPQERAEVFSFALAVVLTPPVIVLELHRLLKTAAASGTAAFSLALLLPGLLGMVCSFVAGLGALRWLSKWLEAGRWHFFGFYCLAAAAGVFALNAFS